MNDIRKDIIAKAYEVRDVTRKSIEPFRHLSEKEMVDVVQTKEFGEARLNHQGRTSISPPPFASTLQGLPHWIRN